MGKIGSGLGNAGKKVGFGFLSFARNRAYQLLPIFVVIAIGLAIYLAPWNVALDFILAHLGYVFWGVLFVGLRLGWALVSNQRRQDAVDPKKKAIVPKPLLPPFSQSWRDWFELIVFLDTKVRRIVYAGLTLAAILLPLFFPLGRTAVRPDPSNFNIAMLSEGWELPALGIQGIVMALIGPLVWFVVLALRCRKVEKQRMGSVNLIYQIAKTKDALKYPIKSTRVSPEERPFQSARTAISVKKWAGITRPEEFFVAAPQSLDVKDQEAWTTLQANLEAKLPSPTGWHLEMDELSRGATVMPAHYPTAVEWQGQIHSDPLTFLLGADLDKEGEFLSFTFNTTSPHAVVVGSTGGGKTSVVEAIVAQAAIKPMPWSPEDDPIFAQTTIIDPKGPFANRWADRANIEVVNGSRDGVDPDSGDPLNGVQIMANKIKEFRRKMDARGEIVDSYGVDKWLVLPEEVRVKERMAPEFLVLDEYLDHTDKNTSGTEEADIENAARAQIQEDVLVVARKGRSFGYHLIVIAQMANMTAVGPAFMRQLVARIMMGNMDETSYYTFFGKEAQIPPLPTFAKGKEDGIPGRGRIMNAPGMKLHRMQAFYFGGEGNDVTLNKFLPKGGSTPPTLSDTEDEVEEIESEIVEETTAPDVAEETGTEELEKEPTPDEPAEETPKPKKKPKPETEVVDAEELFAGEKKGNDDNTEHQCVVEDCDETPKPCDNPKCDNYVCARHKKSPDGSMWVCPRCAKRHVLSRNKLGSLYPWAKNIAEKNGGTATWQKTQDGVEAVISLDGVEIVKINGSSQEVWSMNGESRATGAPNVRKMVKESVQ